jgi:peroxiredoxin
MKKIFFLLFFFSYTLANGQQAKDSSMPVYLKDPSIPSFSILKTDSTSFTKSDLPKNKSVILIYFSPDCSHCQYEAKQIVQYMDSLRNAFFVWVSYHPMNEIKEFNIKYGLDKFKNILVGRDTKYFIPAYYKVENTPFIAVYNRQGIFTKEFREGAKAEELIRAIR